MGLTNRASNRQTETAAAGVAGTRLLLPAKTVEHFRQELGGYPRTVIAKFEAILPAGVVQRDIKITAITPVTEGIFHKDSKNLAHTERIAFEGTRLRMMKSDGKTMCISLGHDPCRPFLKQLIQIKGFVFQNQIPGIRQLEQMKFIGQAIQVLKLFHYHGQLLRAGIKHAIQHAL